MFLSRYFDDYGLRQLVFYGSRSPQSTCRFVENRNRQGISACDKSTLVGFVAISLIGVVCVDCDCAFIAMLTGRIDAQVAKCRRKATVFSVA